MKKRIALLGSTGSIGTQCLEVARIHNFEIIALVAHSNLKLLEAQAREFRPKVVVTANDALYTQLKTALSDIPVRVMAGRDAIKEVVSMTQVDLVVNAITGIAGLRPTLAALNAGKQLALANKEALIVGGEMVMSLAKEKGATILPVDSEHSAIWQSLHSGKPEEVKGIILTASGGPFFGKTKKELEKVTIADALAHPNWTMGRKISIDSATLMNKGLEFIEAMWLFDLQPDQIEVVVHRQSIVHSAVEFIDGSVIAQMGSPDMRVAIQYAITYPDRLPLDVKPLSLTDYGSLTFERPDLITFTCLSSCVEAAKIGGLMPCVINGANEQAVALFLDGKIGFNRIGELVSSALDNIKPSGEVNLENIEGADKMAREHVISKTS